MDKIRSLFAGIKPFVEAHALGVGATGLVALVVGSGVGIAGLTGGDTEPVGPVTTNPVVVVSTTTAPDEASDTTGDTVPAGDGRTLIAVKVDNVEQARPQVGLDSAAMVIEVPVEGGLTRFTAFYEEGSYPALVGPVRSVRPVDVDLVTPFSAVIVSSGGQPFVLREFGGVGISSVTSDLAPGFQSLERPVPQNVFVDLSQVQAAYPPSPMQVDGFPRGKLPAGADAGTIEIPYAAGVSWEFTGDAYGRSESGAPFMVLADAFGEASQLTADTVVVLFAAQRSAGYTDSNDADVPTFDVIGAGRLLVFHGGEVVEGTWQRSAQADPYLLFTNDGVGFGLPEGRTHVAVVPRELEVGF